MYSPPPEPKKRGALFGHLGWFRHKPKKIDRVEIVKLEACPLCGHKDLKVCQELEEHIQEDIVLPQVRVTKYIKHHYYCRRCGKVVSGQGQEELPHSYIGPRAWIRPRNYTRIIKIKKSARNIWKREERPWNDG